MPKASAERGQKKRGQIARILKGLRRNESRKKIARSLKVTHNRVSQILVEYRAQKKGEGFRRRLANLLRKRPPQLYLGIAKEYSTPLGLKILEGLKGQAVSLRLRKKLTSLEMEPILKVSNQLISKWLREAESTYPEEQAEELKRLRLSFKKARAEDHVQGIREWKRRERTPDKDRKRLDLIYTGTTAENKGKPASEIRRLLAESNLKMKTLQGEELEAETMRRNALRQLLES